MATSRDSIYTGLERIVARTPDHTFLVSPEGALTYAELDRAVRRAAGFWAAAGVAKGDRVVFVVEDKPSFVAAWFGLAVVGGIVVGVNPASKPAELLRVLDLARPSHLLSDVPLDPSVTKAARAAGIDLVSMRAAPDHDDALYPEGLHAAATSGTPPRVQPVTSGDDVVSIIYTSGSSGTPKGVMQTHRNFVLTGEAFADWIGITADDRLYLCLPLSHVNAQAYTVMGAIAAGASIAAVDRFSLSRFWSDMRGYGVTTFNFIGAMLVILAKEPPSPVEVDHQIRVAYGVPAFPNRAALEERFGFRILCGYGMSETTFGMIESLNGERRDGSMGTLRRHPDPDFAVAARVIDHDGRDVADMEVGELLLRNDAMMAGYFEDPDATAERMPDGWLHTGDMVRRDPDGFFYFVDRRTSIIRRRGENVSSREIESVVEDLPAVSAAAAIGVPSELMEQDILVVVVCAPRASVTEADIIEHCEQALAPFKVPRYIQLVAEIPLTSTHKIDGPKIRGLVADTGFWFDREFGVRSPIPAAILDQL